YLYTYFSELHLVEKFWIVAKSKVKHHKVLQEDTLSKRMMKACSSVKKDLLSVGIYIETENPCNGQKQQELTALL
ncbi:hypothetical protein BD408DRAFT_356835, partial [Parasitella parasitica]